MVLPTGAALACSAYGVQAHETYALYDNTASGSAIYFCGDIWHCCGRNGFCPTLASAATSIFCIGIAIYSSATTVGRPSLWRWCLFHAGMALTNDLLVLLLYVARRGIWCKCWLGAFAGQPVLDYSSASVYSDIRCCSALCYCMVHIDVYTNSCTSGRGLVDSSSWL